MRGAVLPLLQYVFMAWYNFTFTLPLFCSLTLYNLCSCGSTVKYTKKQTKKSQDVITFSCNKIVEFYLTVVGVFRLECIKSTDSFR